MAAKPDIPASQSPTVGNVGYRHSGMHGNENLGTDYFPGVIDTSKRSILFSRASY